MKYLFLSPHLDDVVFSAGAKLVSLISQGHDIIVATFFTEGPSFLYKQRKEDDLGALSFLGAHAIHLGLQDAPFRSDRYRDFDSILFNHSIPQDEVSLADRIKDEIQNLKRKIAPDSMFAPLGVGGHIDHHLLFEASRSFRCIYYEDVPYTYIPTWAHTRWYKIGAHPKMPKSLLAPNLLEVKQPFLQTYGASVNSQKLFLEESSSACIAEEWDSFSPYTHPHLDKKERAMHYYTTEWPFLLKNSPLQQETYWRQNEFYAT